MRQPSSEQESRGIVTDVSEALNHDRLVFQAPCQPDQFHVFCVIESLADTVVNTPAGGAETPLDAALRRRLARHAREVIDAARVKCVVSVRDPCHLPLPGPHIRRRNIVSRPDEALPDQLGGETAGDLFDLFCIVLFRVEADAAL
jgi:hypothetical protein